jgi:hypothetical protein
LTVLSLSEGTTQLQKSGSSTWAVVQAGTILQSGDSLRTGDSSRALITFFDGTTIELKAGTQVEISSLLGASGGGATIIQLKQQIGETISTVTKLIDTASRYEIETPAAVAGVRGSKMIVKVESSGRTTITNIEGNIYVRAQGVEVTIPVDTQVSVNKGEAPGQPQPTATNPPTTPPVTTVGAIPSIAGVWNFTTTVIQSQGVCSDELGLVTTSQVLVLQDLYEVSITSPSSPGNQLAGRLLPPDPLVAGSKWVLVFSGTLPDKGGIVSVSYILELTSATTMTGIDNWTWTNGLTTCLDGKSSVTVSR